MESLPEDELPSISHPKGYVLELDLLSVVKLFLTKGFFNGIICLGNVMLGCKFHIDFAGNIMTKTLIFLWYILPALHAWTFLLILHLNFSLEGENACWELKFCSKILKG